MFSISFPLRSLETRATNVASAPKGDFYRSTCAMFLFRAFLDASKYDAIYFQVVPRPKGASVKVFQYPDDDDRVMGILVETPTIKNVLAQIKATGKKRRAAKAKSKKKT